MIKYINFYLINYLNFLTTWYLVKKVFLIYTIFKYINNLLG